MNVLSPLYFAGPDWKLEWNTEQVAELKRLTASGHSSAQTAAILSRDYGRQVTRNMILGKLHRLGMSKPRFIGKPTAKPPAVLHKKGPAHGFNTMRTRRPPRQKTPPRPPIVAVEPIPATRVNLFGLKDGLCHWPCFEGHELLDDKFYCGAVSEGDLPYCTWHCNRAYTKRRAA